MRRASPFTTIRTEGGLLPADLLARVAGLDRDLEGISPDAYHLDPGVRLNEVIAESWKVLSGRWPAFTRAVQDLPASDRTATSPTREWLLRLFAELGYGRLQPTKPIEIDGKLYPVSHGWGAVPIHLVGARLSLEQRAEGVTGAAKSSPHGLVQEFLNRSDDHLWGFTSNGLRLRVLRDNAALTRQAFVDFDLEAMFAGQAYSDFAVLWLLCHQSRVEGDPPEKCILERWSADAARRGTRALDQLRAGVESAITELGGGFLRHPANTSLKEALRSGRLDKMDYQREVLRLVYRLLFLLVAEARDVLLVADDEYPSGPSRYRGWYSLDRLRELAELHRGGPHPDLWQQLNITFTALGQPKGEPRLALPGLGSFLWSHVATPNLDHCELSNAALLSAVLSLTSTYDAREKVRRPVDYRNLGTEELGSVYESLLELHPDIDIASGSFRLLTAAGNERKTTGSYYTPSSLIAELLDSALEPVLDEAVQKPDPEAALLALTVLDPACGSGHFLIAAGHRIARRLASIRSGDVEPGPYAVRTALRDVVGRCLHGIDVNEMAVELCKVSLWIEAVEPGKPLSFLDHRIVCGNSLLGTTPRLLAAGIPDGAFKALTGDDKVTAASWKRANALEREGQGVFGFGPPPHTDLAEGFAAIDSIEDSGWTGVQEKQRRWSEMTHSDGYRRSQAAADAWCAAFMALKRPGTPRITTALVRQAESSPTHELDAASLTTVRDIARRFRFCHLHLVFPHVFEVPTSADSEESEHGWTGGFTIVLGNPPWDQIQYEPREVFAFSYPDIATSTSIARRNKLIASLADSDPQNYERHLVASRDIESLQLFIHENQRFPLGSVGRLNTAPLFLEVAREAQSVDGQTGLIVPSGVAFDAFTQNFFRRLIDTGELVSFFDYENRAGLFPTVDSRMKFALVTLRGRQRRMTDPEFAFFLQLPADLRQPDRRFVLTPDDFALMNPNTRTCPIFRSRRDAELTRQIYRRTPVLFDEHSRSSPWGIDTRLMFMGGADSHHFTLCDEGGTDLVPLYEGKMIGPYDHRAADVIRSAGAQFRQAQPRTLSPEDHSDPTRLARPMYCVERREAIRRLPATWGHEWLIGWKDLTSPTNERTLIPFVLPLVGSTDTAPLLFVNPSRPCHRVASLVAAFASFAVDYIARNKLGGLHLRLHVMKQVPIPPPSAFDRPTSWDSTVLIQVWLSSRVLELVYTAWNLEMFARDLDTFHPPFRWNVLRRELIKAELDAAMFHLFGVDRHDVAYIMDTFPIVRRRDEDAYGDYRTKRLILERYDALAEATASGRAYQTVLDPPPAHPSLAHPESTRPDWAAPIARTP